MCLSKMAADSDIKHRMLDKACIENDVVMAECLILLGADINKKTKKDSLIYQVSQFTWIGETNIVDHPSMSVLIISPPTVYFLGVRERQ